MLSGEAANLIVFGLTHIVFVCKLQII